MTEVAFKEPHLNVGYGGRSSGRAASEGWKDQERLSKSQEKIKMLTPLGLAEWNKVSFWRCGPVFGPTNELWINRAVYPKYLK